MKEITVEFNQQSKATVVRTKIKYLEVENDFSNSQVLEEAYKLQEDAQVKAKTLTMQNL